jgi:hypothetical protein
MIDRYRDATYFSPGSGQTRSFFRRPARHGSDSPKAGQVSGMQRCGRLTAPPQDEVELVTNSTRCILPKANKAKWVEPIELSEPRARGVTLDISDRNRPRLRSLRRRGSTFLLKAHPAIAAHSLSAPRGPAARS